MNLDIRARLRNQQKEWEGMENGSSDFEKVPDGNYDVEVVKAIIKDGDDWLRLNWHMQIISSKHKGRYVFENTSLEGDQKRWTKTNLGICGIQLERYEDLPDVLDQVIGKKLKIKLVSKESKGKMYQNVYFESLFLDQSDTGVDIIRQEDVDGIGKSINKNLGEETFNNIDNYPPKKPQNEEMAPPLESEMPFE